MERKFDIELRPDIATGNYSNLVVITHSTSEFILDFIEHMPGMAKAQVVSRVVMTPEHAKRLLGALSENIAKYESINGPIKLPEIPKPVTPMPTGNAEA